MEGVGGQGKYSIKDALALLYRVHADRLVLSAPSSDNSCYRIRNLRLEKRAGRSACHMSQTVQPTCAAYCLLDAERD
jgi:hypothetical protein